MKCQRQLLSSQHTLVYSQHITNAEISARTGLPVTTYA